MLLLVNLKPISGRGPARAKARDDGLTAAGITRCGDDEASVRCSGEEPLWTRPIPTPAPHRLRSPPSPRPLGTPAYRPSATGAAQRLSVNVRYAAPLAFRIFSSERQHLS